uniref:[RNA-polymerase]-subunit kinase n=1 Tax=Leersia perrieri TaxID=77586 RepID=A0A0D9Y0S9_9ORYZ
MVSGSLAAPSIWTRPVRLEPFDADGDGDAGGEEAFPAKRTTEAAADRRFVTVRLGNMPRNIEAEQIAAGWPSWLSSVAAEAIGQGTYSSVFRARNVETGRMVALKKVRFDSGEPESVRFMAREIVILRRLHSHRNVVSLLGLISSRSSPSVYLVFDYLHHDLAGLSSHPDLSFSPSQIKCYMKQLLMGLEHCHKRGVMHRDIKCANLLVSDGGELKVADFGLANVFQPEADRSPAIPMTSRVVTLWYRPPELLLGATAYGAAVDLWSAGCVFAEMHLRRPVLQGRTEVEQIHRIFKLCGSPGEDYWRRRGNGGGGGGVFRPQQPYESRMRETFRGMMDEPAFRLLETLLSVEPSARGTASEALDSEYFRTEPYACDPASLPKYAPYKEMDAKLREDSRRRGINAAARNNNHAAAAAGDAASSKRLSRAHKSMQDTSSATSSAAGQKHGHVHAEESLPRAAAGGELQPLPVIASKRHAADPPAPSRFSGPVQLTASTGFAWAKKTTAPTSTATAKRVPRTNSNGGGGGARTAAAAYETEKREMMKQWAQVADAFTATSESYVIRDPAAATTKKHLKSSKKNKVAGGERRMDRVGFSGPLLSQPRRIEELLHSHEQQIRRAGRRSWFHKGSKRDQH